MKITALEIDNFMIIGHIECSLEEKGLVLIQGENLDDTSQDSNGSGKSSLADALSWCIYGVTARGDSGDDVVNDTVGKNCVVAATITDDGNAYKIIRHRKHKTHKNQLHLFVNGIDQTKGTDKLTQAEIVTLLGCSVEVFNAAIYAGQECMPDLPGMTDKMLKTLVEEAAGTDKLQAAHEIARAQANDAQRDLKMLMDDQENQKYRITVIKDGITDAKQQIKTWGVEHTQAVFDGMTKVTADAQVIKKVTLVDTADTKAELEDIETKLDAIASEKAEETRLAALVATLSNEFAKAESKRDQKLNDTRQAKRQFESVDQLVGTPCGECARPYEEHNLADGKAHARKRLEDVALEAKAAKQACDHSAERFNDATKSLADYRKGMSDTTVLARRQSVLLKTISDAEAAETALLSAKQQLRDKIADLKKLQAETNPHQALLSQHESKLTVAEKALQELTERIQAQQHTVEIANATVKVFGPAGVRAHILDTVTPFLNQRTAEYLGELSDGNIEAVWSTLSTTKKGELREKFGIDVKSLVGGKRFKSLSGGEKRKVRLACSMALQDLVSSRATKPIELYIADEIDDAMDDSGLERLMSILDKKAQDKGTVLVISHNALSSFIRQQVTITKQGGLSTMSAGVL